MSELYVTVLGLQFSLCMRENSSSASSQRPERSHALMRLLYVITLRSQPFCTCRVADARGAGADIHKDVKLSQSSAGSQ